MRALALAVLLTCGTAAPLAAQGSVPATAADEERAIGATIDGIYAAISGPVGQARDWAALRSLMTEDARLTPIGTQGHLSLSIDDYIARSERSLVENGFFEVETGRRVERYGNLAHVWSAYEGRQGARDGPIASRGINSFQLVRQDGRWTVYSILWQPARDDLPVPADLAATPRQEPE